MGNCIDKANRIASYLAFGLLAILLASCGGGGGSGSDAGATAPVQSSTDAVFTGGGVDSPDSNIVFVPFSNNSASQSYTSQSIKSRLSNKASVGSAALQNATPAIWISQSTTDDTTHVGVCPDGHNGYCGFAAMMMGAAELKATPLIKPPTFGHSTAVGQWIIDTVNAAFPPPHNGYDQCGGEGLGSLGYLNDFKIFAEKLGIAAARYKGSVADKANWIANDLNNGNPVMAQVPYQGANCTGMLNTTKTTNQYDAEPAYYNGGNGTPIDMVPTCNGLLHWVLITGLDQNSVTVYDPDPFAINSDAGIRKYSTSSFLTGLQTRPLMYELCPSTGCQSPPAALAISSNPIVLNTNQNHTAVNTPPIVNALTPDSVISATGLPSGTWLDTEGRILGNAATAGTYSVPVTMTSTVNGILRSASSLITVVTQPAASIVEDLQFITPSSLNNATVGNVYLQPIGITGNAETPTFSLVNGNLPPGLRLQNGQIVGTPTQFGVYSVDIQAATSTSSVTKTFTLNVDPAPVSAVTAPQPVLSGISPPSVTGSDSQQAVLFTGSGFADGALVELTDTTNGGTYLKTPVSINSAGTQITISEDFTSNPGTWSASIIPQTGNPSASITFPVVAPVNPGPVISSASPSALTASPATQTITLTGTNIRAGAIAVITNLATGIGASVQPIALASGQLTVSYPFATPSMWGARVINSDGTSSDITDIQVNAPSSMAVPSIPTLMSPGSTTGPGPALPSTNASLSWSGDTSASYYTVAVRDLSSGELVADTTTVTPAYAVNLLEGKQYRWNAAACNAAGCSNYPAPLYFQSPQPPVAAPTPVINSLSLTSVPADSTVRALTIYGNNFAPGDVVMKRWGNPPGGSTSSATVSSDSQLSTTFNPGAVADTIYVKVCQSASSSACSVELPISVTVGSGGTQTPTCTVSFNTASESIDASGGQRQVILTTSDPSCTWSATSNQSWVHSITPLSGTAGATLTYTVDPNSSTQSRSATITAGQTTLTINQTAPAAATPSISSINPVSMTADNASHTLTISGSNFASGDYVQWQGNSSSWATTYGSPSISGSSSLSVSINPGAVNDTLYFRVCNSSGSCSSSSSGLTVTVPAAATPSISSINPTSMTADYNNHALTIYGSNFGSSSTLTFLDPQGSIYQSSSSKLTFVSSSQINYQFNDSNDPGTWEVLVDNPGGQTSNVVNITVQ